MENVLIGKAVSDVVSVSPAIHQLGLPHYLEMLGCVRHRLPGLDRKILDGAFALSQKFD